MARWLLLADPDFSGAASNILLGLVALICRRRGFSDPFFHTCCGTSGLFPSRIHAMLFPGSVPSVSLLRCLFLKKLLSNRGSAPDCSHPAWAVLPLKKQSGSMS